MSDSPIGFQGITLNGVPLRIASAAPIERERELKSILEGGPGGTREHLAWREAGLPLRTIKRRWQFTWAHVRGLYDTLLEILAGPAPFELCFWKMTHHHFLCDGARTEFYLPHPLGPATDWLTEQPSTNPIAEHLPVAKLDGVELTYDNVDAAGYVGAPSAGTVKFLNQGARFKLAEAPAAGAVLVVRYVPLYQVLQASAGDKRYESLREPLAIELVEV